MIISIGWLQILRHWYWLDYHFHYATLLIIDDIGLPLMIYYYIIFAIIDIDSHYYYCLFQPLIDIDIDYAAILICH
jgi:hypothetical protein